MRAELLFINFRAASKSGTLPQGAGRGRGDSLYPLPSFRPQCVEDLSFRGVPSPGVCG